MADSYSRGTADSSYSLSDIANFFKKLIPANDQVNNFNPTTPNMQSLSFDNNQVSSNLASQVADSEQSSMFNFGSNTVTPSSTQNAYIPTQDTSSQTAAYPAFISSVGADGTINRGLESSDSNNDSLISSLSNLGNTSGFDSSGNTSWGGSTGYSNTRSDGSSAMGGLTTNLDNGTSLWDSFKSNLGTFKTIGDLGMGAFNAWQGMQQLDQAQETFDFNKATTNRNIANSAQALNTSLEDRQNARTTANPNAYMSTSEYMAKNKLDGSAVG